MIIKEIKMKKRITAQILLFMFIACFGISLSGCKNGKFGQIPLKNTEYYIYTAIENKDDTRILGLTDKGKEQEYLIIPESIDGKRVSQVGCTNGIEANRVEELYGETYCDFQSEKLKKVFVTFNVKIHWLWGQSRAFKKAPNFEGLFYLKNEDDSIKMDHYTLPILGRIQWHIKANVSYFYNYENAENAGYYWIDNCDYGSKIEYIPENPKRLGYEFAGWYKEEECINKWDYETDTLPEKKETEGGGIIYQETKLYAKWAV